jgi:hypothetical protein
LEELVVEAKKMGMDLSDVQEALAQHWQRLGPVEKTKGD